MKKIIILVCNLFVSVFSFGQSQDNPAASCEDPNFNRKVNKMLNYSVNVIGVEDLKTDLEKYTLLDARELKEYMVSKIPGAMHLGYDNPKWNTLDTLSKDTPIVVYCSIGYRSEKIGEKLQKKGFTNVKNLYGSIFEWANQGCDLENPRGHIVKKVHSYNKKWSKWVLNDAVEVVY